MSGIPGRLARATRNSVGPSLVGAFGTQGALIVTGVISARLLGVDGRGVFASASLIAYLFSFLGALSTAQVGRLLVAEGFSIASVRRSVNRAALVPLAVAAVLAGIAVALLTAQIMIAVLAAAAMVLLSVNSRCLGILQGTGRFWFAAYQQLCAPVAFAVALVLASALVAVDVITVLSAWVLGLVVAFIIGRLLLGLVVSSTPHDGGPREAPLPAAVLRRGAAGMLSTYSPLDSLRVDQLTVVLLLGPSALGLYVTAAAFSNLARLVGQTFTGLVPSVMQRRRGVRARVALFAAASVTAGALVGAVGPWAVVPVFGSEFAPAAELVLPLSVVGGLLGARTVLAEALRARSREGRASLAELVTLAVFLLGALIATQLSAGLLGIVASLAIAVLVAVGLLAALCAAVVRERPREMTPR